MEYTFSYNNNLKEILIRSINNETQNMGETLRNFKRSNKIAFETRSNMFSYFKDCFRVVALDNELYVHRV